MITHSSEACAGCGDPIRHWQLLTVTRRQVIDISDGRLKVTEHQAETHDCVMCGSIRKAQFPVSVRAQYGRGVLSRSAYLHLYQLIPITRTAETMRDLYNCPVSTATIQRAARVTSGKLVNAEHRIEAAIRDSPVVGVDETGLRVAGAGGST